MADNIKQLKEMGLKATGPRLKILSLFENNPGMHLSAEDIYKEFISEGEDVGLATVYRVLTQFEQFNILVRHHFETGKAVYELNDKGHHDHMVCLDCGEVVEFFDPEIESLQKRVALAHGYQIIDHALYMYGVCQNCAKKKAESED